MSTAVTSSGTVPSGTVPSGLVPGRPGAGGLVSDRLVRQLRSLGPFDADACMNCGVCTATCPLGTDLLPRRLFRYVVLGLVERVRSEHEAVFSCLLCRACESSCPGGVHITANVLALRHWLLKDWGEG